MVRTPVVVGPIIGLDLSLRGAAAAVLPLDWDRDHKLDSIRVMTTGYPLAKDASYEQRTKRIRDVARDVLDFCSLHLRSSGAAVFIEDFAFAQSGAHAREVAELTGVVKWRLLAEHDVVAIPVTASKARKVLLQKLPRKDVKRFVFANVRRLGDSVLTWTEDQVDAFVIANAGWMISGGVAMTFAGVEG